MEAAGAVSYPAPSLSGPEDIRLLSLLPGSQDDDDIRCQLITTKIEQAPPYQALSYTWGDPSARRTLSISPPGPGPPAPVPFSVTQNCFQALRQLRLPEKARMLWVDSICINQGNVPERNHQLTLMADIYSGAREVAIYLGSEENDSGLAIDFIMEVHDPNPDKTWPKDLTTERLSSCLGEFFRRPWFKRVWVVQEAKLAQHATVYCGTRTLPWDAIKNFHVWNTSRMLLLKLPYVVSISATPDGPRFGQNHVSDYDGNGSASQSMMGKQDMFTSLLRSRHCEATNPRDKVYALLPLLSRWKEDVVTLSPDYGGSVATVFIDCAKHLMRHRGIEIFSAIQGTSQVPDLPSWVPDWTHPPSRKILGAAQDFYSLPRQAHAAKQDVVTPSPRMVKSKTGDTLFELPVSGCLLGKITKVGSPYHAGQDTFPVIEWASLASNQDLRGKRERDFVVMRSEDWATKFCEVVSAGFYFVGLHDMHEFAMQVAYSSTSNSTMPETWDDIFIQIVKEAMASFSRGSDRPELGIIPFEEIPFHLVAWEMPASFRRFIQRVLESCHGRRFFVTDSGIMGLAPEESQVGDEVYALFGASVPFVLRVAEGQSSDGTRLHNMVGECYVKWGSNIEAELDEHIVANFKKDLPSVHEMLGSRFSQSREVPRTRKPAASRQPRPPPVIPPGFNTLVLV